MSASVICPVYNQLEVTMDFVMNMLAYVKPPNELVIVVNGCTDSTLPFLQSMTTAGHNLKVIKSDKNLGFGGGNNLGAKYATNPIHVFLSNDVRASGEFIEPIEDVLESNPSAVVGAKIHRHDTGWNTYRTTKELYVSGHLVDRGDVLTIPYVEGWCVSVDSRKSHYNRAEKGQIGGLWDERYFPCDFEDMDVSMQALVNNRILIQGTLPLSHEHTGNTANKIPGGRLAVTLKNQAAFMEKWGLVKA